MMGDFTLVEPRGWEYDLHSVRRFAASIEGFLQRMLGVLCFYRLFPNLQYSLVYFRCSWIKMRIQFSDHLLG